MSKLEYKKYYDELLKEYKGADDSLLHDRNSFKIAEGDGWEAWLKTYGEIRGSLKIGDDDISIYNSNFEDYFKTNADINNAENNGTLELWNNNWFDLEIIVGEDYMELGDGAVAFTIDEGIKIFEDYMADKDFIAELQERLEWGKNNFRKEKKRKERRLTMEIKFNIEETCDLEHYVVQINYTGAEDGWEDITKPFDTQEEAIEWAKMIKDNYQVMVAVPF